jgi:hypothetical protein
MNANKTNPHRHSRLFAFIRGSGISLRRAWFAQPVATPPEES